MVREVSFRELVRLESTTYATHGLYFYPAKFIPHVVRYSIEKYTKPGDTVFDPFSGHGTTAIEASLLERNSICWDLNPLSEVVTRASTYTGEISLRDFQIDWNYHSEFHPEFSNIFYWYPTEFYSALSRLWGFWHEEIFSKAKSFEEVSKAYVLAIPLLKLSKLYSYADEKVPKLYKSKFAIEKVKRLLSDHWYERMQKDYQRFAKDCYEKIVRYQSLINKRLFPLASVDVEVITSKKIDGNLFVLDALNTSLSKDVELLITSPPYLQSQEYIRTFKLELAWLGYTNTDIRELTKHEIPYNQPDEIEIMSPTYETYKRIVTDMGDEKLLTIFEKYFHSLGNFFQKNLPFIKRIAIFVGPAKIRQVRIPIDTILCDHLSNAGYKVVETLIDKIVARRLFKTDVNPATKLSDERTPTEHLLVMVRPE